MNLENTKNVLVEDAAHFAESLSSMPKAPSKSPPVYDLGTVLYTYNLCAQEVEAGESKFSFTQGYLARLRTA